MNDGNVDVDLDDGSDLSTLSMLLLVSSNLRRPEVVRALLKSGADCSVTDKDGNTPLLLTAAEGNIKVARMLIRAGSDLNICNYSGAGDGNLSFVIPK